MSGDVLSWSAVEATAVNVHRGTGEWLESLPATQTQWQAPAAGTFYLVATGSGSWETWGRSDTVTVASATSPSADSQSLDLSAQVYSTSALELFWSSPGNPDTFFEVQRNGEQVSLGAQRSFFDDGLQPGTRYDYSILVVDAAGNVLQTEQISATTQGGVNETDNSSENTLKLNGEVYSQSAVELFWNTDGLNAGSTTAVQIYLDGRLSGESYGKSLFIDTLSAGTAYEFTVAVTDEQGIETVSNVIVLETNPVDTP